MLTLKQILAQICPGDLFLLVDLKGANFNIQITPIHRPFVRFTIKGVAYQYIVLPFKLSLALRTFTKCVDVVVSPLSILG